MRSSSSLSALTSTGAQKRSIACFVWPWRSSHAWKFSPLSAGSDGISAIMARADRQLVFQIEHRRIEKRRGRMKRRGQRARLQHRRLAAGQDEGDLVVPANLLLDAEPAVEVDEVGAAAQQHMLAVVDNLAGAGKLVGRGAAAEIGTPLEELDVIAGVGQRAAGREARESAADDGHRAALVIARSRRSCAPPEPFGHHGQLLGGAQPAPAREKTS